MNLSSYISHVTQKHSFLFIAPMLTSVIISKQCEHISAIILWLLNLNEVHEWLFQRFDLGQCSMLSPPTKFWSFPSPHCYLISGCVRERDNPQNPFYPLKEKRKKVKWFWTVVSISMFGGWWKSMIMIWIFFRWDLKHLETNNKRINLWWP